MAPQVSDEHEWVAVRGDGRRGCDGGWTAGSCHWTTWARGGEEQVVLENWRWTRCGDAGEDVEDMAVQGSGDVREEEKLVHGGRSAMLWNFRYRSLVEDGSQGGVEIGTAVPGRDRAGAIANAPVPSISVVFGCEVLRGSCIK